jgi:putative ABC transport system permease protein
MFRRRRSDAVLDEEIRAHLDLLTAEHIRSGMSGAAARAAARRDFGGVEQMKERYRDQRGLPFVDTVLQDVRYAVRVLFRAPGFTAMAVAILALGIGANTAIFSLVDAALIRPLPFHEPDRLVAVYERLPRFTRNFTSPPTFLDWNDQNHTFASMAAVGIGGTTTLTGTDGVPESLPSQNVTAHFFDVLGVTPIIGRTFVDDDFTLARNVIVVSERIWKTRFGADPGLVGRTLALGDLQAVVIGVVPGDFKLLAPSDFWVPFSGFTRAPGTRRNHFLLVLGRLKPAVSIEAAQSDMAVVAANIAREAPETNRDAGVTIEPLRALLVGDDLRTTTLVLGGVVAFILLLACANVANLLLARGVGRTREVAVRAALGGSRGRIVRQLLTENLVLAAAGGVAGWLMAWMVLGAAPALLPPRTIPEGIVLAFDARLAVFAVAVTCTTTLLVGLAPAWSAARVPLAEAMTAGGRGSTQHGAFLRHALTVVEVAVAVLLATGAGLLARTLVSLNLVDGGYRAEGVVTMQVGLAFLQFPTSDSRAKVFRAVEDEVSRVPGVRVAALAGDLPLDGLTASEGFTVAGSPSTDVARRPIAHYELISPRYFEAMGIPMLRGRAFTAADTSESAQVCIVNEEFVRRYLADRDPIGAKLDVQSLDFPPKTFTREVVGVARQVKERPNARENQVQIYVPIAQNAFYGTTIVARTAGAPAAFVPAIKAAVARARKNMAVTRVRTMDDVAAEATAVPRFRAQLIGAIAVLAILLAAAGVFSVFTFTVQQRTREFSVRRALGASGGDVLRLVMRQGVVLVILGLAIGLAAAGGLVRSLASLLFAVKPFDPLTFAGASALLALVALTACALPALRAARSDPAVALRQE